ncbi:hypothetical protein E2I00_016055, partial [Balaenoptera physalus]
NNDNDDYDLAINEGTGRMNAINELLGITDYGINVYQIKQRFAVCLTSILEQGGKRSKSHQVYEKEKTIPGNVFTISVKYRTFQKKSGGRSLLPPEIRPAFTMLMRTTAAYLRKYKNCGCKVHLSLFSSNLWKNEAGKTIILEYLGCPGMTHPDKMPTRAQWRALSVVLILLWGHPRAALACPYPCACYVPSEVHCTFRSLASVPAGISKHVERINLGFNSIQALSETSFAGLTKLELLMIHGNDIPSIPDGALRDLISLQVFKFSYNKLRVITGETLRGLWSLIRLHMDHNKIEFIHPQAFSGLTSLRLLHLEGNLLHQLHPATFSTFTFLDYFRLSTVRHLYLAENMIRTLPTGMLQSMPLLENLYLHGNPWSCDCDMRWFLEWGARSKGILKCKKDKAYEGGQLCSMCFSPRKLHKQEIQKLKDITCEKPSIESPLRQNRSRSSEEDQNQEEDGDNVLSLQGLQYPVWNVSLNMSDEHGNTVNLVCDIKKPMDVYQLHLNQTDPQEIEINATVALDFECPMTRENYEKLWKLIAYYSEVPVKLHRQLTLSKDPRLGYQYRQDADDGTLYYTGVRAHILAEPEWVTQPSIDLQLNRRQSTAKTVLLSYSSQHALTVSAKDARPSRSRSWVMIEPSRAVQRAQTVLEGSPCQLSCNVKASERPSISWVLPDGSVLKAPMEDKDGRFSILTSGWLKIKSTEQSDAGLYQCIARVRDEMDRMVYRVLVQRPVTQPPAGHTVTIQKNPGEPVMLPCNALAIPEAEISWILPNRRLINNMANTSHAYMLADGTLSIPKVQGSDGGYYRCAAVNQQGADHFTVGLTVSKKGSARASKRGRRPGGKTLSRGRGDVVEDEGGSGIGDEGNTARRVLHPKDQEMFIKAKDDAITGGQKTKKGRRKLKHWKTSEKEPETNIAEGRRVFESRRRINMANKQINPEHWADILARVRGRNLPKGTEVPQVIKANTPPSESLEVTPLLPAVPPRSVSPVQTTTSAEESSGDVSLFGEEEQVSSTVSSTRMVPVQSGHDGVILAHPKVTSTHLQEFIVDEFSEKTKAPAATVVDSNWATATTLLSVPYESSTLQTLDMVHEEPTNKNIATEGWSTLDVASMPGSTSSEYEPPLDAISLAESETLPYFYQGVETNSQPGETTMKEQTSTHVTPVPALWVANTRTSEPFEDPILGDPKIPAQTALQEQTESPKLVKSGLSTQGHPLIPKGTEENSQTTLQEGGPLERDPKSSRSPERKRQGIASTTVLDSALEAMASITALQRPRETTLGVLFDKDTSTLAMMMPTQKAASPSPPTTHPSRKRPNGRRRLRPHRFRHRHKQTPPATFAPAVTFLTPLTQVPEVKTPSQAESLLVPTSWVDSTVGTPKQVGMEKHAEPVSKGTPRRKHGKRPKKHRYITSTVSSIASVSKPSPSPENKYKNTVTPSSVVVLSPTTISLTTGDPRETTRVEDYRTTTTKTRLSHDKFRETIPVTYEPVSDGKEIKNYEVTNIKDYKNDSLVPGESVTHVASPSGAEVSTAGVFKEASPPSGFPGTARWTPPRAAQPERLQTDPPVTSSSEALTDSPFLKELEDLGFPSEFSPSAVSMLSQQEEVVPSTTLAIIKVEASSSQAETTIRGQSHRETTPAIIRSEIRHQSEVSTRAPVEEPTTPFPPTTRVSLAETTAKPTPLTSETLPTSNASKQNIFFHYAGETPATRTPSVNNEGTQHVSKPNEISTPSSHQDKFTFTPKQESRKEAFDGTTKNSLPRGPDSHHEAGRVQGFHQPASVAATPVPPRGTTRPPHTATQSSFRYVVTLQPHLTSKLEIAAYPSRDPPENKHFTTPKLPSSTTPVVPLPGSKPSIPSKATDQGTDPFNGSSKLFGDNNVPDPRDPAGRLPDLRAPHYPDGRFPFFFNRTLSFPQLAATLKPQIPTSPAPGMRGRKVSPGPYNRTHSQSISHVGFGPPAPPVSHLPRTMAPPSTSLRNIPLVYSTRSSIPFITSSAQPSRSFHQSNSKLFSSGGPPASKFWTLGEKPQIITKSPQTVSVTAETDVMFPCEAMGKPKPFVTWTKLSTGALMTPNTRVQRFEVLKNGTFVIRNVQVQDRGQYMCTAKNLHGADRMVVLLSVTGQQPQIPAAHYKDVTVYLGDTIAMECLAKGTPAPQISWIFPDRRVWQTVSPVEGRVTLHENRTLTVRLTVQRAAANARITGTSPQRTDVRYGGTLQLDCSASGDPWPRILWRLPSKRMIDALFSPHSLAAQTGTHLSAGSSPGCDQKRHPRFCAATSGLPSLLPTQEKGEVAFSQPIMTKVYHVEKWNVSRRVRAAALCAEGSENHKFLFRSGDLKSGERAFGRLTSYSVFFLSVSFDTRIKAFANGTLVVKSVTDKDAGDYLCVARNKVGDDFVMLKVNVVMKPAKIEHKEENDHKVFYGGDLKVDCRATGLPNPEISWSLPDGSLVNSFMQSDDSGGRTKRYVVFNNGTLYFNEVVTEPAVIRNKTYSVVQVPYGDVVTVACEAKGEPTPRVTWLSPANRLIPTSSDKYQIYQDGTLLIQKAQRSDSGNYTCVVRNSAGEDRKAVWVRVNVQSPKINGHPNALTTVREIAPGGSRKLIDCKAEGIPTPRVLWAFPEGVVLPAPYYGNRITIHRNGTLDIKTRLVVQLTVLEPVEKPIFHDPRFYHKADGMLHISGLSSVDAGAYRCVARNSAGYSERLVSLKVGLKPETSNQYHNLVNIINGETLQLPCILPGARQTRSSWTLPNGVVLEGPQADTEYGPSVVNVPVIVIAYPPRITSEPTPVIYTRPGSTVKMNCMAVGIPKAEISWELPDKSHLTAGAQPRLYGNRFLHPQGSLTIQQAAQRDAGFYKCTAKNLLGRDSKTTYVHVY